ncbi:hypothetical protein POX_e07331 [Penicillium oxalicum]|uniref:hypothetical protein n=1 Tax=Penicillium oxalicum TaxID=69781 RepID=UPI0020B873CB|nr:hypothetical protein POX_e07331 [Penicillium oxalicum]KAI2789301.1 hypothetical protein POX_e07331 [Penicillium oxalicum]
MTTPETFDVIIIGAGISGINAAYRVQTYLSGQSYIVLEARNSCGGTWDLFQYPGVRLDSDIHTFGFPWHPYQGKDTMVPGKDLLQYLKDTVHQFRIAEHIRYNHRVTEAAWSSYHNAWEIRGRRPDHTVYCFCAKFVLFATGYFDHDNPGQAQIQGITDFCGKIIHPQLWPEAYNCCGKKIVIIGSGATAVSLLPKLVPEAASVTLVQRSPNYIVSIPTLSDPQLLDRILPYWALQMLKRIGWLMVTLLAYHLCRLFPVAAKNQLLRLVGEQLPARIPVNPHFQPSYPVWDQRLLACPNGDFFEALHDARVKIETGHIATCTQKGLKLKSGVHIQADVIITATGLRVQIGGRIALKVDGKDINMAEKRIWNGMMLQDLPNAFFSLGYLTTASWTMGTDLTAMAACRMIHRLRSKRLVSATPRCAVSDAGPPRPLWNLESTYLLASTGRVPLAGSRGLWKPRRNYIVDYFHSLLVPFASGIEWKPAPKSDAGVSQTSHNTAR